MTLWLAALHGQLPCTSTVGGRASLQSLLAEPDFALASFLLSGYSSTQQMDMNRLTSTSNEKGFTQSSGWCQCDWRPAMGFAHLNFFDCNDSSMRTWQDY
jgi:hypothetical protein